MSNNAETASAPYQVLARKYRPQSFDDLIGHGSMVRTLRNAFATGRIAHAWVLTGVRGVGKTTTARILARALNYVGPEGQEGGEDGAQDRGPTVDIPVEGLHCKSIAESRHPDVIEMDAASRTGVNDIRELIEGVRYAPTEARYKVYIIDEVHMLSTAAFNALLKTLEEPPEHVKFIFATTEIRKLPVTVLSRCQRFDLKRIDDETLASHLDMIAKKEGGSVEAEGLEMIARAAEGSVRDALSILDQALLQHGDDQQVQAASIRDMLGLADRSLVWDLLKVTLSGDAPEALRVFRTQYDAGAEPSTIMRDLLETVHLASRVKAAGKEAASHGAAGEADASRAIDLADGLSMNALTRAWGLLMKGLKETQIAPDPAAAGEIALIRLAYAADLPTPDEALKMLSKGGGSHGQSGASSENHASSDSGRRAQTISDSVRPEGTSHQTGRAHPAPSSAINTNAQLSSIEGATARLAQTPAPQNHPDTDGIGETIQFKSFDDVVKRAAKSRDAKLKVELESYVRLVSFAQGRIVIALADGAPNDLPGRLHQKMRDWTGKNWTVAVDAEAQGEETMRDARIARAMADPAVKRAFELFPDAEIMGIYELNRDDDQEELGTNDNGKDEAG